MPRNNNCNHPNCDSGPCKMLTPQELEPTAEDRALAEVLVAEGWTQVSSKFRMIKKWKTPPPLIEEMIKDQYRGSWWANRMADRLKFMYDDLELRCAPADMCEERTLSVREFKAYKDLKNKPWRDTIKRHREEAKAAGRTPNL